MNVPKNIPVKIADMDEDSDGTNDEYGIKENEKSSLIAIEPAPT